jgi:hypothetical protein
MKSKLALLAATAAILSAPVANASPYDTQGFFNCLNQNLPLGWPPNSDNMLIIAGGQAAKTYHQPYFGGDAPADDRFEMAFWEVKSRRSLSDAQAYWITQCGINYWPMPSGY